MLEVRSNKSVTTCFNIVIHDDWSIENDQLIVEINGKKYFCMYAVIDKDWSSDGTEFQLERVKNPVGKATFVSILKNGTAGNSYKDEIIWNRDSYKGVFAHLFDAYNQELEKLQSEQLVGAN
jgi:hypothetical protein